MCGLVYDRVLQWRRDAAGAAEGSWRPGLADEQEAHVGGRPDRQGVRELKARSVRGGLRIQLGTKPAVIELVS